MTRGITYYWYEGTKFVHSDFHQDLAADWMRAPGADRIVLQMTDTPGGPVPTASLTRDDQDWQMIEPGSVDVVDALRRVQDAEAGVSFLDAAAARHRRRNTTDGDR